MEKLGSLKGRAMRTFKKLGHVPSLVGAKRHWKPLSRYKDTQTTASAEMECRRCGMAVVVEERPPTNGLAIGGKGVALVCLYKCPKCWDGKSLNTITGHYNPRADRTELTCNKCGEKWLVGVFFNPTKHPCPVCSRATLKFDYHPDYGEIVVCECGWHTLLSENDTRQMKTIWTSGCENKRMLTKAEQHTTTHSGTIQTQDAGGNPTNEDARGLGGE